MRSKNIFSINPERRLDLDNSIDIIMNENLNLIQDQSEVIKGQGQTYSCEKVANKSYKKVGSL